MVQSELLFRLIVYKMKIYISVPTGRLECYVSILGVGCPLCCLNSSYFILYFHFLFNCSCRKAVTSLNGSSKIYIVTNEEVIAFSWIAFLCSLLLLLFRRLVCPMYDKVQSGISYMSWSFNVVLSFGVGILILLAIPVFLFIFLRFKLASHLLKLLYSGQPFV